MAAIICSRDGTAKYRKHRTLKVWPPYFAALKTGEKPFEVRVFSPGDECEVGEVLLLDEWHPDNGATGQSLVFEVSYTLKIAETDEFLCLPFPKTGHPVWVLGIRRV